MVKIHLFVAFAFLAMAQVFASPVAPGLNGTLGLGKCTHKLQRRSWQTLSNTEKKAYIDAELCLMWHLPAKSGLTAAVSRFDDLIKAHQNQSSLVHGDGWFLPFHRLMMHAHERLLRQECGYTGAQPYWDEEADAGRFSRSEIFDAEFGFGGDGTGRGGCVETGPFANYTLHTGPGYSNTEHCLIRKINDSISEGTGAGPVDECLAMETFAEMWPCLENVPHSSGHTAVGGEMQNPISSPGDPLFYLHHTWLDRVWWRWQQRDPRARLRDIAGYTTQARPASGWVTATLDDELNMFGIIPNARIRDVMDSGSDLLCVEYV